MAQILKIDEEKQYVFGWANISLKNDGGLLQDLQGDEIHAADLEEAAYQFTLQFRDAGVMHQGDAVGRLIESCVITPEKLQAMGLVATEKAPSAGWWCGFHVEDAATFAKVKSGDYSMFSIQGHARIEEVPDAS